MKKDTRIIHGDFIAYLSGYEWLAINHFLPRAHAVFCDPPYFLGSIVKRFGKPTSAAASTPIGQRIARGFMGQTWDGFESPEHYQAWVTHWANLLKSFVYPGALLLAFGGTRTYHRLAAGLEDAGWSIVDSLMWVYANGFPKGHSQAKDFRSARHGGRNGCITNDAMINLSLAERLEYFKLEKQWKGHNTALKPAFEPIIVARSPFAETYADLARLYGVGGINIDGCRIPTNETLSGGQVLSGHPKFALEGWQRPWMEDSHKLAQKRRENSKRVAHAENSGRWPANFMMDCSCETPHDPDCPISLLNQQSGDVRAGGSLSGKEPSKPAGGVVYGRWGRHAWNGYNDDGGAARFYFCSKAQSWEREAGLKNNPRKVNDGRHTPIDNPYQRGETKRRNTHPTVKPIQLTEYLARLILPPDLSEPRRILIPFSGSGSEMIGARLAGWDDVIGVEQSAEYVSIAQKRLDWWRQFETYDQAQAAYNANKNQRKQAEAGQLDMFAEIIGK